MRKDLVEKVLNAYSIAMNSDYATCPFVINGYKEEYLCLNNIDNKWYFSIYERGQNKIRYESTNVLDVCINVFNFFERSERLKEIFLENL